MEVCKKANMKFIPVMSFHQCGGNVGDACGELLPSSKCDFERQLIEYDAYSGATLQIFLFLNGSVMLVVVTVIFGTRATMELLLQNTFPYL
jgi:hypothetical protein